MTIHLGNDSAVRRQIWADRARDADGDVAATAEHADAHTGIAAASPGALLRLLAPSPRDPNAQRARSGHDADGAVRDQPTRLVKLSPPKLPREPMWHAHGPRGVAAEPVTTRLPSPTAPPLRETIVRAAVIAPRGQPVFGDGGAIVGAAGTAAAVAIATQPALQPASTGRLVRIAQSLQTQIERAHHQAELRHNALTPTLQGGASWLHHLGQFSGRLHALIARLHAPVPALQAAARDAAALDGVTSAVHERFAAQAGNKEAFTALLRQAFGNKFDAGKAETIRQQALAGDFSWAPQVKVVDSAALADLSGTQGPGSALGAYVASSDTIYISRELLHGNPAQAQRLLMEEMGHGLDARINTSDAVGDEGEIFSKLMHGDAISAPEMAALKADNDRGVVNINGQAVTVEYGFFSKIGKAITGGIKKVVGAVTKGVVNLAKSALTVGTGLLTLDFDKVKDGLKDGVNAVKTSVKAVHEAVKDSVKEIHRITKQAFQKLMQSKLFAAVLMVCRFIPIPIVQLVVHIVDAVRAGYMVYQGIKHKSLGMVLGGVASLVGGAGNVAGAFGASASTVSTISSVANAASKLSMAYNAVANKDMGAALGLLGGASGVQGTALGTAAGYVQQGLSIRQAVRSGDAAAALGGTFGLAQSVSQQFGAGVQQQQQREAEAADNRGLLNAADKELRAMPAVQDGAVAGGPSMAPALDNRGLLNASERESNPGAYANVAGSARVARAGDSVSSMVGTSDPQAIGNFMRANNLASSNIEAGRNYFIPADVSAYGNKSSLGQTTLNKDNARLAALAQQSSTFSDDRDARDMRESFSYRSRMSAELTKLDTQSSYAELLAKMPGQYLDSSTGTTQSPPVSPAYKAVSSAVGMVADGLGVVAGGAMTMTGAGLTLTPEPTTLTKWAGVPLTIYGATYTSKSAIGFGLNATNFITALGGASSESAYMPGSALEWAVRAGGGSPEAERAAVAADMAWGLATGRVLDARLATGAVTNPSVAALLQPARATSVNRQTTILTPQAWTFVRRIEPGAGLFDLGFKVNDNAVKPLSEPLLK
jgi:hypothetical protein